jgi:hypothetical protein
VPGGILTVTDSLPSGMTASAMSGTGWTCSLAVPTQPKCTRAPDGLAPAASFPPITLNVNVNGPIQSPVFNQATLSGIGDSNPANNNAFDSTVVVPAITMTATTPTFTTVNAGTAATFGFTANLATNPAVGTVTFTTSALPANSKVTFNPASVTATGPVVMTWDTSGNGHVASLQRPDFRPPNAVYATLFFAICGLLVLTRRRRYHRKPWMWMSLGVCCLLVGLTFTGCGGSSSPPPPPPPPPPVTTPPGTYVINVVATPSNGSVASSTMQIFLTVK